MPRAIYQPIIIRETKIPLVLHFYVLSIVLTTRLVILKKITWITAKTKEMLELFFIILPNLFSKKKRKMRNVVKTRSHNSHTAIYQITHHAKKRNF